MLSFEYPPMVSGGLGTFIKKIEKNLVEKGVKISIFMPSYNVHLKKRTKLIDKFQFKVGAKEEEFQVHLMTGETGNKNVYLFSSVKKSARFNEKRIYYWKGLKAAAFARCFLEFYKKHLSGKKIVMHANDWHSGLAAALVKSQYPKVPMLYTIHLIHPGKNTGRVMKQRLVKMYDIEEYLSPNVMKKYRIRKWIHSKKKRKKTKKLINVGYWLEPIIVTYADRVNTVSRGFLEEVLLPGFKRFKLGRKKFTFVFNGLDVDNMVFNDFDKKAKIRKELLSSHKMADGNLFLNLGRQNMSQKATDLMVRAIHSALKNHQSMRQHARFIILVAEGRKAPKKPIKLLRGLEKKYPKNVRIIAKWVKDVEPYYRGADFFLLPSRFEPFGFTQIEAMCRGVPVIGSRTSGIADVQVDIDEKKDHAYGKFKMPTGILHKNNSSTSLANCMYRMQKLITSQPTEYRKLQINGLLRARQFSVGATTKEYIRLYNELLKSA